MTAALIDFHCHLDLYPDLEEAARQCEADRIFTLAVTTTPAAWQRNRAAAKGTKHVRPALGLHPQLVGERPDDIGLWHELLPQARYVGEVGLDAGSRFYRHWERQKAYFERVLVACAGAGDKILTIHSVRAGRAVLDAIEAHLPQARGRAVLHWFTGSASEARRAVELGCYFSINEAMLTNEKHAATVRALPRERLLTETDGPFTETEGRPNTPHDVARCVSRLADLLSVPPEQLRDRLLKNLKVLIG